jgi:two-component system cell cycle sensor histidine kinase PleC
MDSPSGLIQIGFQGTASGISLMRMGFGMRSTETSGGDGEGFHLGRKHGFAGKPKSFRRLPAIAPVTYAIAFTAVLAATLYVVADTVRTFDDLHQTQALLQSLPEATAQNISGLLGRTPSAALSEVIARAGAAYLIALLFIVVSIRRHIPLSRDRVVQQLIKELLATIPFGVACWSSNGRMIVCNEQYQARLNAESNDTRPGASYSASVRRLIEGGYMQLVSEDSQSRILELHREDGSCLLLDERPLGIGGFVTLVTDVTERRRTDHLITSIREEQRVLARRYHEQKLKAEAASESKTRFLAHLSHDIRTPLNHIIGFAEMMRHQTYGPLGDPRYTGYVDGIKSSGERLLSFFASILDLAELESGRRVLQVAALDVDDLLTSVKRRFAGQAERAGIELQQGAPCDARLMGDRFTLERMLSNLVDNALRFTRPGGRVTLNAFAAEDGVVLEVTDSGVGMSAERLSALSQPFAFGDAALTKDREGAGLGLAISRAIVQLSGGHLAIDSRLGIGTTVAVSLPMTVDQAEEAA